MSSHKGKVSLTSLANVTDLSDLDGLGGDGFGSLDGLDGLSALDAPDALDPNDPIGELDYENLSNEEVAVKETSAVLQAFIDRSKAEQARFLLATDSEYWVGLCFQTREQKEHFLREAKLLQHGDKYIDGALLAKRMGIELPPAAVPYNISAKVDAKYAALVKDL
ncbi:MAG: hypothetical protein A3E79_11785 [Burkholderiales bacterium RIFCSPHIGHO2_12_FULL_61_11]|nr:MAG: hypothetical protein A3E79_11785 [Burkholderiales bacterium RIFCSPHIGHO2_12_FULL_61_11]